MITRTTPILPLLFLVLAVGSISARKGPKHGGVTFESLSQKQGFSFDKSGQDPIGFINALTVGATTIEGDLQLRQPTASRSWDAKSVGVLGRIAWGGASSDPIELTAYLSAQSYHRIEELLREPVPNSSVRIDFVVYNFDPIAKKYYRAFYPNDVPLRGVIRKNGAEPPLKLGAKGTDVVAPENWALSIVMAPPAGVAQLTYTVANSSSTDKVWGGAN
jgi:hypothetical protein